MRVRGLHPGLWLYGPAVVWLVLATAGLGLSVYSKRAALERGIDRRGWAEHGVAGSQSCKTCHPAQYETWHRSFHRTMTQRIGEAVVLAPFRGETLDVLGFRATMDRDPVGQPRMKIARIVEGTVQEPPLLDVAIELTIGSHRMQQYVARIDRGGGPQERWRLPLAWHVGEQRWIHLSGAFLLPQGRDGATEDYFRHWSRWNDNCVLCHNTEPNPARQEDGTFLTEVGEIGIACEACHGPAAAHVEQQRWPFHRLSEGLVAFEDPTVTPGQDLTDHRAMEICGRCHGNRIARDLAAVLAHGDPFVPGTSLAEHSRPIERDSTLAGSDELPFVERFWPDRTPRLSAYEYQALQMSPCHREGGLECSDCHTMHGPEPKMQLRPQVATVCEGCHRASSLSPGHGHPSHASVACQGCHMPRVTYGLVQGMMSHRIAVPTPAAWVGRHDQPDACTQCHLDRSRVWAAQSMAHLGFPPAVHPEPAAQESWASRVELDLRGGDPIARALAVDALARPEAVGDALWRKQVLVDAMDDDYPAVRWMAWRALRTLEGGEGPALWLGTPPSYDVVERTQSLQALRTYYGSAPLRASMERLLWLEAARDDRAIEIGE